MLSSWLLKMFEHRIVFNVSHLLCQLSNGELTVSMQVIKVVLLLPKMMILLLKKFFNVLQFLFLEHSNTSLSSIVFHEAETCGFHFVELGSHGFSSGIGILSIYHVLSDGGLGATVSSLLIFNTDLRPVQYRSRVAFIFFRHGIVS